MTDYTKLGLLQDLFRRQAETTPDSIAVVGADGNHMTYGELNTTTDLLAVYLQSRGVVPDQCVGIYMERCVEYVISYIAILKAGGAYLPLDVAYPNRLLNDILIDAAPKFILSKTELIANMDTLQDSTLDMAKINWLETVKGMVGDSKLKTPEQTLDNLAYTVYSSGTTGKPKGIQCPHRGAVFSYTWRHDNFPYDGIEHEAANVFFVWELLRPLCKGSILYVVPDTVIYDPPQLAKFIQNNSITRQLFTPSLWETLVEFNLPDIKECMKTMKQIIFCGEVVTTSLLDRSIKLFPWIQFVNLYSISESHDVAACDLTAYYQSNKDDLMSRKYCPVGKLISGVKVCILGDDLSVKPVGVAGEIYIGGPALALGYLNRPDLNHDRFIVPPENSNISANRLYKTGDWGYLLSDGSMEICGRCDSMHKIRGYSIEVQAIEAALLELRMVNNSVVLVLGDEGEDKFLVAYVVPEGETSKRDIREALKRRLPFYMIPSYFVLLSSIPILAFSGKLDKKSLPAYDSQCATSSTEEAGTETERKLLSMWREVLGAKHIDVQESFFDLGGHSLMAARLLAKISNDLEVVLTVQDLFKHPTITSMSKLIDALKTGGAAPETEVFHVDIFKEIEKHDQATLINMDMQLRAFWRMFSYRPNWKSGSVLLTGSSGFLGAFLLKELLIKTQTYIHCIIRTGAEQNPMDRLLDNLKQYQIINNNISEELVRERVSCISGDISLLRMGLSVEDYGYLLTEIDYIVHAAAYVNLIYPYKALHAANVMGTENVIVFASTSKIKPVHYISTDAVFPDVIENARENIDMTQFAEKLSDGYSQTKWVAEQLMLKAGQRGLPLAIYRCGNISGDQQTAAWNKQDFILGVIQAITELGIAPDVQWNIEMTPVDFVSQVVIQLTQKVSEAFGKIFHLIQPKRLPLKSLVESMNNIGYKIQTVSLEDWLEKLGGNAGKNLPFISRIIGSPLLSRDSLQNTRTFKNKNLLYILPELDLQYPDLSAPLITNYITRLHKRGAIRPPQNSDTGSLEGRVAIVTGASSGIGEAVARHLSVAGAKVALGARRENRLTELKQSISASGGTVRYTVCDVVDRKQVDKLVSETESEFGPVDILVNNAGIMYYSEMTAQDHDGWMQTIDVNCKGVVNGVGAVLDSMTKRKSGHIINMSSDAGRKGFAGIAVYSGTKFFVEGFSQAVRHEMLEHKVKVTCIQPGDVKTELQALSTDQAAVSKYDLSNTGKVLCPDDIARAVVYAASQPKHVSVNELLVEPSHAPI